MLFEYDEDNEMYWRRHKLSNGQFCMIGFERDYSDCGDIEEYNVIFAVADKKKQLRGFFKASKENNITLRSTGRCGVEALYWARDMILQFERVARTIPGCVTVSIVVAGEDSRRFHLYERALSRYGYKKAPGRGNGDFPWYMKKTVLYKGEIRGVVDRRKNL